MMQYPPLKFFLRHKLFDNDDGTDTDPDEDGFSKFVLGQSLQVKDYCS